MARNYGKRRRRRYKGGRKYVVVSIKFGRKTLRHYRGFLARRRWADNVRNRMTFMGRNRSRMRAKRYYKGRIYGKGKK